MSELKRLKKELRTATNKLGTSRQAIAVRGAVHQLEKHIGQSLFQEKLKELYESLSTQEAVDINTYASKVMGISRIGSIGERFSSSVNIFTKEDDLIEFISKLRKVNNDE